MTGIDLTEPNQPNLHTDGNGQRAVVGIDLGTTNSLVAVAEGEQVKVLSDETGAAVIPSAVFYGNNGTVLTGTAAVSHATTTNANTNTASSTTTNTNATNATNATTNANTNATSNTNTNASAATSNTNTNASAATFNTSTNANANTTNTNTNTNTNTTTTTTTNATSNTTTNASTAAASNATTKANATISGAAGDGATGAGVLLTSVKRLLGLEQEAFAQACGRAGYGHDRGGDIDQIAIGTGFVTPVEVSAQILKMVWALARTHFKDEPEGCVITVPAYFGEKQRQAVRLAARLQGINVLRLLDEPTAAAIAYGLDHEDSRHVLVYDLGGGTFDVSVIRLHEGVFEVLAIGGDDALGGDDFDSLIVDWMCSQSGTKLDNAPVQALRRKARQIKEALTSMSAVQVDLSEFGPQTPQAHILTLTVDEFEAMATPLVNKTIALAAGAVRDSGLQPAQLDKIILSGGATRAPLVGRALGEAYEQDILDTIDPEQVVAHGAALHAGQLVGNLGNRHLLLGVLPLSLGIETLGGIVEVVLPRNTTLPARQVQHFTTHQNSQTGINFHVVQGEREMSRDCRSLARFELKNLPSAPAGMLRIELCFEVDADGLLSARAREPGSGAEVNIEVRPSSGLSEEQAQRMLQESFQHAEDDHRTRLLGEQKVEGERALEATKSLLAKAAGTPKALCQKASKQAQAVQACLGLNNYDQTQSAIKALNQVMEELVDYIFDQDFRPN